MVYKYSYSLLPGLEKTGVLAPLVPITFSNDGVEFSTLALVDSGAEQGIISTDIAEALNINWRKFPKKVGLTTSGHFIFHTIPLINAAIDDNEIRLRINVVEGVNPFKCILGRKDLFQQAKIIFEGYKNMFSFEFLNLN